MLKVHTSDGLTSRINLENEEQAKAWLSRLSDPRYQENITGLTIAYRGVQYSLSRPQGFTRLNFLAEQVQPDPKGKVKGGERIFCFSDEVRIGLMVHKEQRAVRVSLVKIGKRRFSPNGR